MKKIFKILVFSLILCSGFVIGFCVYCQSVIGTIDKSVISNLNLAVSNTHTTILDNQNNTIISRTTNSSNAAKIDELNSQTINAFLAAEDHNFYRHHGINPKRIIKAGFKNLKNGYNKEGASTITQQLVKNTMLSNEKTFERKIKEAYLATQLENKFTKDEILESYLNAVYFGSNAYGIESAANLFFDKKASNLDLNESATLAGILKSPKNYSPIYNIAKSVQRRNTVLKRMLDLKYITQNEYENTVLEPLNIKQNTLKNNELYINYTMQEAASILNLSEKDIASMGYKIYTFLENNEKLNAKYQNLFENEKKEKNIDGCLVMIDNNTMGVNMLLSNKNAELKKRQPASLIKPILCYAPAFDLDILAPATPILDEQTSFNGYEPKNSDDKYDGWISTRDALIKSKNIPAIKTLSYVGIDKAKEYAKKCGIDFSNDDNHLALSLGSLKNGITPLEACSAYCTFSNQGNFEHCHFVKKIEDKFGNMIYNSTNNKIKVFKEETCYITNDVLKQTPTQGTAKRLSQFKNICAKTGTNGVKNSNENLDAWCVVYNPEKTICSWIGNTSGNPKNNLSKEQNGSNLGAKFCELILKNIDINFDKKYQKPDGIITKNVTTKQVNNQQILLLDDAKMQKNTTKSDIFTQNYISKLEKQEILDQNTLCLRAAKNDEKIEFSFNSFKGKTYCLNKIKDNQTQCLKSILGDFPNTTFTLENFENDAEYYVSLKENDNEIVSNKIKIKCIKNLTLSNEKISKQWFFK